MKALKQININNKSKQFLFIILAVIILIFSIYFYVWSRTRKIIINTLNIDNNYIKFKYDNIKIGGFPFFIKSYIKNLDITLMNRRTKVNFKIDNVLIKNLILTKNVNIDVSGDITFLYNDQTTNIDLIDKNINLTLTNKYKINNVDMFAKKIILNEQDTNTINELENFTFKTIQVNTENYNNTTTRINIDRILTTISEEDVKLENNFELIISNIKEIDSNNNIVYLNNNIDTFVFNDITNNYAISLKGDYNINLLEKNILANLDLELKNYNSLVFAINNKKNYFIFNKNNLKRFLQILALAPKNEKNTKSNKFYRIEGNLRNKTFIINNTDINKLIERMFLNNEIK